MPPPNTAENLALMSVSEDVHLRGVGVVGTWLSENTEIPDPIEAAKELFTTMGKADLVTLIRADLEAFVAGEKP